MSCWTHVFGTISVEPMGRTQPEKRYILDTVLDHLPRVTGSEGDMEVYVVQRKGHNSSCSCDEFGMRTNNLTDSYGEKSRRRGWLQVQDEYLLVLRGNLRDRTFEETKHELLKWLCRLSKRVIVKKILVGVNEDWHEKEMLIQEEYGKFHDMFETPSWARDYVRDPESNNFDGPNWCEYLMWDRGYNTDMPLILAYKYYADKENDEEAERRMRLWKEE